MGVKIFASAFGNGGVRRFLDLSRAPTAKEAAALAKRKDRLIDAGKSRSEAMNEMRRLADTGGLEEIRLRSEFIRLAVPPTRTDYSDRSVPPSEDRPPSTRLMSPNGIALKFLLIALFEAQSRTKPGQKPAGNSTPLIGRSTSDISWSRYIASGARPSGKGKHRMSPANKKLRTLRETIDRLEKEDLVDCPNRSAPKDKQEGFLLMREDAVPGRTGDLYKVPSEDDDYFTVPTHLFTNGWIYVLEDSELALLLIATRMRHKYGDTGHRITASTRLLNYGLSRDSFYAHQMLDNLKLLQVLPDEARWLDGTRVENYSARGAKPHSLRFLPEGLQKDGPTALLDEIEYQLGRI
ncbi:hypothetical protein KI427_27155 (plasmid) [Rhodococcus ruber]|uniref:hypothetical protein n=1 Tax=Rhodococcus ruber TaxID=1830 RepID=UPI002010061A|nr:hypothetical protein [Rhodococcus ruber]UQB75914.1 hypothetical protein KI427_27155 [Rhodococcus ruber]